MSGTVHAVEELRISECVIDASVGVKLFLDDPLSEAAHALFAQLTTDPPAHFYVPDLFYIEVTNVLWKYVRWQVMAPENAKDYLEQLAQIALSSIPTSELMVDALSLAMAKEISASDGCYLTLANRLDAPLITADQQLAKILNQPTQIKILGQS
jgi:predicted nucleic acid-binding protein